MRQATADSTKAVFYLSGPDDDFSFKDKPLFNIGTGTDLSIKELAELIKEITDFKGEIVFDTIASLW